MTERISTKVLIAAFLMNYIGWDNRFLVTLRLMFAKPWVVISEYLNGIRSRYMPPIVFVGLGVAIITILYNTYSAEYLELSDVANRAQLEMIQEDFKAGEINQKQYDAQMDSIKFSRNIQKYQLKYLNIVSFLFLPFFALISRLVFGGKFNYGEHLVINSYLQGLSFFMGIIFFLGAIYIYPPLMFCQLIILMFYYLRTYSKLMNFGVGKATVKLLLFFGIILLVLLFFVIAGVAYAVIDRF